MHTHWHMHTHTYAQEHSCASMTLPEHAEERLLRLKIYTLKMFAQRASISNLTPCCFDLRVRKISFEDEVLTQICTHSLYHNEDP